jgi:hypothetical protein
MTHPKALRVASILIQDVVDLIVGLEDFFFQKSPNIEGTIRSFKYEDNGLMFMFASSEYMKSEYMKTHYSISGRYWSVHLDFDSAMRFNPTAIQGFNASLMNWRNGTRKSWQALDDWKIIGDELEFCSDMAKAKMFGLLEHRHI